MRVRSMDGGLGEERREARTPPQPSGGDGTEAGGSRVSAEMFGSEPDRAHAQSSALRVLSAELGACPRPGLPRSAAIAVVREGLRW